MGVAVFLTLALLSPSSFAQENNQVEVNGDQIEYQAGTNLMIVKGNVSVIRGDTTLYADQIKFDRQTQQAYAYGHVVLETPQGEIWAEELEYDFKKGTGDFKSARLMSHPYYAWGESISRVDEDHFVMENGYLTTSDYDDPGYRITSDRIDIIINDEAIARRSKFKVGKVPFLYIPKYSHDLKQKPRVRVTPGHSSNFGAYVLTAWRYELNDYLNGRVLLDYRERKDFASGINGEYRIPNYGKGVFRTYYMNERNIGDNHLWDERLTPTIERERYRAEIRHDWDIDQQTKLIGQYVNLSDPDIIQDYFEREYREDANPNTFMLLSRSSAYGNLSLRVDKNINRFNSSVERLPELRHSLTNQEIGESGFYVKSTNSLSNLVEKSARPVSSKERTVRFDTDNELSKPFKWAFLEMRPFIGSNHTYYSKTLNARDDNTVRSLFKAGWDVSTKIFRVFDVDSDLMGVEINQLRHLITPSLKYLYQHEPTHLSSTFNQFDGIDARSNANQVTFSLENKLQTKRNNKSVDLVRLVMDTPFYFSNHPGQSSWGDTSLKLDMHPADYMSFFADARIDSQHQRFDEFNFDWQVHDPSEASRWKMGIGKRWLRTADDQVTASLEYKINPKWRFSMYERFDLDTGELKEQEYAVVRDLHSWEFQVWANDKNVEGLEVMFVFSLKAFPDSGLSLSRSYPEKNAGRLRSSN